MAQAGSASATVTDEQFAVRDMVRSWAASSKSIDAVRAVEQGDPDAWRAPYRGLAQLGTFGVAIPEELGGAGGSVEDLCLMVDEAAAALVPGPVATTALATLVITDETLLEALASGERTAGVALVLRHHLRLGHRDGHCRVRAWRSVRRCSAARCGRAGVWWSTRPPTASPSRR